MVIPLRTAVASFQSLWPANASKALQPSGSGSVGYSTVRIPES